MAENGFRVTLRVKLLAALIAVSIVPLLVISYYTYQSATNFLRENLLNSLEGIADLKAQAIDTFLKDRIQEIETVAKGQSLAADVDRLMIEIAMF